MTRRTLLLIDDSPEDRETVRRHLRHGGGGYLLLEEETADAGLRTCREHRPDCVLLDFNLPDLDGLEFLDALAGNGGEVGVPVVVLTGQEDDSVVREALKRGAQDYLVKGNTTPAGLARVISNSVQKFAVQRELAEQRAMLEHKNRELETYTSVVAHDLRNPLGVIGMSARFLLDLIPDEPARAAERKQVELIVRAVDRTNHLVADLLDVSRIEGGGLFLERESLDPASLVREAVDLNHPMFERQKLDLRAEVEPDLPPVCLDRDQVLRALQNLLDNAAKFTDAGGSVTVRALRNGGGVGLEVEDTGAGIPAGHLPHLFDRFWQARNTDRRGLGLGLAIVKGIVDAHGGTVRVESTAGRGTVFHLGFPDADRCP